MTQQQIEKAAREIAELEGYSSMHYKYDELRTDCYIAALKMAKWLLSHQWISVDEELPQKDDEYFIKVIDEDTGERFTTLASFVRSQGGFIGIGGYKITHWMPIPPLKGGEE